MTGIVLIAWAALQATSPASKCELHVWPTKSYYATFHGATPSFNGYGVGVDLYLSPMDEAQSAMRAMLSEEIQSTLISEQIPGMNSPVQGYKIILHEAPETSRFANWLDKRVGDGPRATESKSSCYAELHLIALTVYKTALYKELQTIYVFRGFGDAQNATKTVRDAARTRPGSIKASQQQQTTEAELELQGAFARSIGKIFENRKLALKR